MSILIRTVLAAMLLWVVSSSWALGQQAARPGPYVAPNTTNNLPRPQVNYSNYNYNRNVTYAVPNTGYYPGYSPYIYAGDPYGGYLNGAASVINAQGNYLNQYQQAAQQQEQLKQMQLDTRRKQYEEWLYERSATPTLNDERVRIQAEDIRRSLTNPPNTEIWAGVSLNSVLTDIQAMRAQGMAGPSVPLRPDLLRHINLTTGKGRGTAGILKEETLNWPYGLQILQPEADVKKLRDEVDQLIAKAKQGAKAGRIDAAGLTQLDRDINLMRDTLVGQVHDYAFNDYTAAKRFLAQLDDAVNFLKQPDAAKQLNGQYAAQGNTVQDLVDYMTNYGLTFGAAMAGEEASYTALHAAMVQYDLGTRGNVAKK